MKRYDKECPACRVMCQFEDGQDETTCLYCGELVPAYEYDYADGEVLLPLPFDLKNLPVGKTVVLAVGVAVWFVALQSVRIWNLPEWIDLLAVFVPMPVWGLIFFLTAKRVPKRIKMDVAKMFAGGVVIVAAFALLWYFYSNAEGFS